MTVLSTHGDEMDMDKQEVIESIKHLEPTLQSKPRGYLCEERIDGDRISDCHISVDGKSDGISDDDSGCDGNQGLFAHH